MMGIFPEIEVISTDKLKYKNTHHLRYEIRGENDFTLDDFLYFIHSDHWNHLSFPILL